MTIKNLLSILTIQFVIHNKPILLYLTTLVKFMFTIYIESIFLYYSILILLFIFQMKLISIICHNINLINKNEEIKLSYKYIIKNFFLTSIYFNTISMLIYMLIHSFEITPFRIYLYLLFLSILIVYVICLFLRKYWNHKLKILKILILTWIFGILMRNSNIMFFNIFLEKDNIILLSLTFNIFNYLFPLGCSNLLYSFPIKNIIDNNIVLSFSKKFFPHFFPIYRLDTIEAIITEKIAWEDGNYLPQHINLVESLKGIFHLNLNENQRKVLLSLFHTLNIDIHYSDPDDKYFKNLLCSFLGSNTSERHRVELSPFCYQTRHRGEKLSVFNLYKIANLSPTLSFSAKGDASDVMLSLENILNREEVGYDINALVVYTNKPNNYRITTVEIYQRIDFEEGCDMLGTWEKNDFVYLAGTDTKYAPSDQEHELQEIDFIIGGIRHKVPNFRTQTFNYSEPSRLFNFWYGYIKHPFHKYGLEVSY